MNYRFKWMGKKEGSDADDITNVQQHTFVATHNR